MNAGLSVGAGFVAKSRVFLLQAFLERLPGDPDAGVGEFIHFAGEFANRLGVHG